MTSNPRKGPAGRVRLAPCLGLVEGAWRLGLALPRTLGPGLILFAVMGIAGASCSGLAAEEKNDPMPHGETQPVSAIIRDLSVHTSKIQVNVDWVILPVTVSDEYGYIQTDLAKNNFEVFDDKVKQDILTFSTEDTPIAACIVFDTSRSMSDKIQKSKEAAIEFFRTSNPQDLFMLVAFSNRPYLISDVTGNYEDLLDQVLFAQSEGRTSLMDAIYAGIARLKRVRADRKALLVISDGGDNHSRYTISNVMKLVKESNVQIYTIGVFAPVEFRYRTPEEAYGPSLLSDLARISGGKAFSAGLPEELPDIAAEISFIIRHQYIIGYKPSNLVRDGRWRHIKVKTLPSDARPRLQVSARTGYYAPTQ